MLRNPRILEFRGINMNENNDLLTDPLGSSSLLNYLKIKWNYINYNYKINQIKLFRNYTVETGLTEIHLQ